MARNKINFQTEKKVTLSVMEMLDIKIALLAQIDVQKKNGHVYSAGDTTKLYDKVARAWNKYIDAACDTADEQIAAQLNEEAFGPRIAA